MDHNSPCFKVMTASKSQQISNLTKSESCQHLINSCSSDCCAAKLQGTCKKDAYVINVRLINVWLQFLNTLTLHIEQSTRDQSLSPASSHSRMRFHAKASPAVFIMIY